MTREKTDNLFEQTKPRPHETLEYTTNRSKQNFSFFETLELEEDSWVMGMSMQLSLYYIREEQSRYSSPSWFNMMIVPNLAALNP